MNKKLISWLFAFALVANVVLTAAPVARAAYDAEYLSAHSWGLENTVTSMPTPDSFMPWQTLGRQELAKMISNFGENFLCLAENPDAVCDFADASSVSPELSASVEKACKLGLMRGDSGKFYPNAPVTKSQVLATLVRGMSDYMDETQTPWYKAYYDYAIDNALTTVTDVYSFDRPVTRYEVLLMLYRARSYNCETGKLEPDNGSGDNNEVKAGNLNVSLNSASLPSGTQIPSTGSVRFAVVDFSASSADVNLKTVELEKLGLAMLPTSTRVWFELNGVRVTGRTAFTSDGKAVLSFAPALNIPAGQTKSLDLYVSLSTTPGYDIQFKSTNMTSSAVSNMGGFTTPVLRTVNYSVLNATFNKIPWGGVNNVTTNGMELGAFTIAIANPSSETRHSLFKGITLRQNGNGDLSNLGNVVLERNGTVVSTAYSIDGRNLTFSVNDEIKDATTASYYVKAVVNDVETAADTYQFELRNAEDLNTIEKTTAFRTTVSITTGVLDTYTIQGGELTFARDTSAGLSSEYPAGSQDVVLLKGTIKSNSSINVEDPKLALNMSNSGLSQYFSTIYMNIGGSTFSYSPSAGDTGIVALFGGTAVINGTVNVKVRGTLKDTAPIGTVKVWPIQLSSFTRVEYTSNGYAVWSAIGSIEGVNMSVESAILNVTRIDGKGNQPIAKGTSDFTVLKLQLASNQGNGIKVSKADFNITASGSYTNNVSLTLLIDGVEKGTKNVTSNAISFNSIWNFVVDKNNSHTIELKATFAEAYSTGTFQVALASNGLNAVDNLTSQSVSHANPAGAVFTIASPGAQVSPSTNPVLSTLFASPSSNQKIISFRVKAINDNVKLRDVTFTGTSLDNLTNFRLSTDGTVSGAFASANSNDATTVTFTNIASNAAPVINKDDTVTYYLIADVNSNTTTTLIANLSTLNIRSSNGSTVTGAGTPVAGSLHTISENVPVFTKVARGDNFTIKFTVSAQGINDVTLDSLVLNNIFANYDLTNAKIVVYKWDGSSQVAGSTAPGTPSGTVNLTGYNVVSANTTATYRVVIENIIAGSGNGTLDRQLNLNNIYFNSWYSAIVYNNVGGALPFKEQK